MLGPEALSPLTRAIARARPDHREALAQIQKQLEQPPERKISRTPS